MVYSKKRHQWSDSYMEAVRCALGKKFFGASSFKEDTQHAIDLFIPELRLAVRVRDFKYSKYKDFTLRTSSGSKSSEYAKILDPKNKLDFIFYAYAMDERTLAAGYLIDVTALKTSIIVGEVKPRLQRNRDKSHFVTLPLAAAYTEQIL